MTPGTDSTLDRSSCVEEKTRSSLLCLYWQVVPCSVTSYSSSAVFKLYSLSRLVLSTTLLDKHLSLVTGAIVSTGKSTVITKAWGIVVSQRFENTEPFSFPTYVKFPKITHKQTGKINNSDLNHSVSCNRLFISLSFFSTA